MQYTLKRLIDKHPELCEQLKAKCYAINGACAAVHRELGPFLNEYMYQEALQILLDEQQIPNQQVHSCSQITSAGARRMYLPGTMTEMNFLKVGRAKNLKSWE